MGKILVIAEKPKIARELLQSSRFRGSINTQGSKPYYGYFENDKYIMTWARGHLYEMMNPGDHSEEYKPFKFDNLPLILPLKYKPIQSTTEQLSIINSLMNRTDVDSIINAFDGDKEGQLIFKEIYEGSKSNKPVLRLWLSSYTLGEIEAAFNNLVDDKEYESLGESATARQILDHLIGDTVTRASTVKLAQNKFLLSSGRIQLCILNEIRTRELEIENFVSRKFYNLFTDTGFLAHYQSEEEYILNPSRLKEIGDKLKGQSLIVKQFVEKSSQRSTPNLFNATDFLKASIQKLKITAPQAKEILQKLYEGGHVSYPRTDSRNLPESMVDSVKDILSALPEPYNDIISNHIDLSSIKEKHKIFNDEKVSSHYGIIPTTKKIPDGFSELEKKVYDLIVKRFLSAWMQPATYKVRELHLMDADENLFLAKEKVLIEPGYLVINKDDITDEKEEIANDFTLPELKEGDDLEVKDYLLKDGTTKKPAYHTETSILTFMETAGRNLVEEEEIKELLKGKRIGTPATAESFVPKLFEKKYIQIEKGKITTTPLGASYIDSFPVEELKNPVYTAEMEEKILKIQNKEMSFEQFKKEIEIFANYIVEKMGQLQEQTIANFEKAHNEDMLICKCSCKKGEIVEKGNFYVCTNTPECNVRIGKKIKGKSLPVKQVEKLITKGETDIIKGFDDGNEGTFEAILVYSDGTLKMKKALYGNCPICKSGEIKKNSTSEGKEFFGCSNYKNGCKFTIPSVIKGKRIPEGQIRKLLKQRTTDFIEFSKDEKVYTARISIKEDGGLQLLFPTIEDKTLGKCPLCKGNVIIGKSYYLCTNYKNPCDFIISPVYAGKKINSTQVIKLLEKNLTDTIKGFSNKDKTKTFDAKLSYNTQEKRLTFVFENKKRG